MQVEFFRDVLESLRHLIRRKNQSFFKACARMTNQLIAAVLLGASTGGMLELTDDVMAQLKEEQPNPQPTILGSLFFGPIDDKSLNRYT